MNRVVLNGDGVTLESVESRCIFDVAGIYAETRAVPWAGYFAVYGEYAFSERCTIVGAFGRCSEHFVVDLKAQMRSELSFLNAVAMSAA